MILIAEDRGVARQGRQARRQGRASTGTLAVVHVFRKADIHETIAPDPRGQPLPMERRKVIADHSSTEDAAKQSLPGSDPEVNKAAGDKAAPPSLDEGDPKTKDDGSGTSETD